MERECSAWYVRFSCGLRRLCTDKVNPLFDAGGPPVLTWYYQAASGSPAGSLPVLYLADVKVRTTRSRAAHCTGVGTVINLTATFENQTITQCEAPRMQSSAAGWCAFQAACSESKSLHCELLKEGCAACAPQCEALKGKLVYVARAGARAVSEKTPEADLLVGEVPMAALEGFQMLLSEVFVPLLAEQAPWGRSTGVQAHEFLEVLHEHHPVYLPSCLCREPGLVPMS